MILAASYHTGFAPRDGYSAYPELWRGCVGAWAPCLGPTGLTLRDWSGRQNHGTLTNMVPGDDWVVNGGRYALDFDGVNDHVNAGDILNSTFTGETAKFTITGWVNTTTNANQFALSKIDTTATQRQWFLRTNDDGLDFAWYGDLAALNFRVVRAPFVFSTAGWVHFAVTFDATIANADTKAQVYINGRQRSTSIAFTGGSPVFIPTGTAPVSFACGFAAGTPNNLLTGRLDSVQIFSRVLAPAEIQLLATRRGIAYEMYRPIYYTPPISARRRKILTGQV